MSDDALGLAADALTTTREQLAAVAAQLKNVVDARVDRMHRSIANSRSYRDELMTEIMLAGVIACRAVDAMRETCDGAMAAESTVVDDQRALADAHSGVDRGPSGPTRLRVVSEPLPEPALPPGFSYAPVDHVAPTHVDVENPIQGPINNCHLAATMTARFAEAAHGHAADRAEFLASVRQDGDTVVVSLPGREYHFAATLPVNADGDLAFGRARDGSTLFPFYEKAYAHHVGGYANLDEGNEPYYALEWLTGQPPRRTTSFDVEDDDHLRDLVRGARLMVATSTDVSKLATSSGRSYASLLDLDEGYHATAVTGVDDLGRIVIADPASGAFTPPRLPMPLSPDLFWRTMDYVDWV